MSFKIFQSESICEMEMESYATLHVRTEGFLSHMISLSSVGLSE